eukprot:3509603-Pyramimonas_sp.AAC.2
MVGCSYAYVKRRGRDPRQYTAEGFILGVWPPRWSVSSDGKESGGKGLLGAFMMELKLMSSSRRLGSMASWRRASALRQL